MTTLDAVLEKFDASKAKVRKEIREGFFHEDGTLSILCGHRRRWADLFCGCGLVVGRAS